MGIENPTPTEPAPSASIIWRLLIASFSGIVAACVPIQYINFYMRDYHPTLLELLLGWMPGLSLSIFGLIIASPLIAITLGCGKLFEKSIDKHTGLWCVIAAVLVWASGVEFLNWGNSRNFFEAASHLMHTEEGVLFLIGPTVSAIVFYCLSNQKYRLRHHFKTGGDD